MTDRHDSLDAAAESMLRLLDGTLDVDDGDLDREALEILGLVGAASDPVEPPAALGRRISVAIGSKAEARAEPPPRGLELPTRRTERATAPSWLRLVAAGLGVCVVGLGALSFSLSRELGRQQELVAGHREVIERLEATVEGAGDLGVASLRENLRSVESKLEIVTGAQTEVCALAPPDGESSPMPAARGTLFVASDHQRWFLKARGLRPLPEGTYQVWFQPEDGRPVHAGSFDVAGDEIELGSDRMPEKTRAIFVTVETEPVEEPAGPVVLYGDEAMIIL